MDKQMLILLAAAIAGPILADQMLVRYGPSDKKGFIDFKPGFGLDDVMVGAATVATYTLVRKVV